MAACVAPTCPASEIETLGLAQQSEFDALEARNTLMTAGLLAGLGWVAAGIAVIALFENRSWTYIAVNGCYQIVAFVTMGAILGAWR